MTYIGPWNETVHCQRCGRAKDFIEVTTFGDPEPLYVEAFRCPCHPRCTFCHRFLDNTGHCETVTCFAFGLLIPIPL